MRKLGDVVLGGLLLACGGAAIAGPPVPYATVFAPGTPAESAYLGKNAGATVEGEERRAEVGKFWVYGFPVAPGARCRLALALGGEAGSAPPNVIAVGPDNKPLPVQVQNEDPNTLGVQWTVPTKWRTGARMQVLLSAKTAPISVRLVRFLQMEPDSSGAGVPDSVIDLMREGMPGAARPVVMRPPDQPYTTTQTPQPPNPNLDLQTDSLFVYSTDATAIGGWKTRGYTVWTMGGARDGKAYADRHRDEVQTTADGTPLSIGESYYLSPTENRIAVERAYYEAALANGSEGICPEEPEYWARAGYEAAFKRAWQRQYGIPWQDPASSVDARWKAGQLMAALETNHIATLLQGAGQARPGARRMVALHSPVSYAQWGIVSPHYRITSLPGLQDVIGQVWSETARTPARYAGLRQDHTFSLAYLEYSSLYHLLRGTDKRLWFLMDPLGDTPNLPLEDYKSHYEQTLIAALFFPDVNAYEVMPWPERVYGHIPESYAIEINSVIAALEEMHRQPNNGGNASSGADIGVFVSDSMQWQREPPNPSDFDGFFGLTLPLLLRGVPVQVVSLDRAADPGYLNRFKTLLLSYDFQKPPDARTQAALADWVKRGGSLLFFGGSDAYNAVADSWWRKAGLSAPQADLWTQTGIPVEGAGHAVTAAQEDLRGYQVLLKGDGAEHNLRNRRRYVLDLTPFVKETGSVAVRFADVTVQDGWGAFVASAELRIGDQLAAAFQAGSEVENRFLVYDHGSQFNGEARFADGRASWTYQFDNLPRDRTVTLTVDMGNGFLVSAASAQPQIGHTLLGTPEGGALTRAFPRLRIGAAYAATVYPQMAGASPAENGARSDKRDAPQAQPIANGGTGNGQAEGNSGRPAVLYTLRSGGAAVWTQAVGQGLIMNVGVAPGFFSASERSAGLLRALTQYACQRVGATYREAGALRLQRGRYTILRTFGEPETVEGRTVDVLSPTLAVAADRIIPPHSMALLYDLGPGDVPPHIGFVSGRVQARLETPTRTVFFARGPAGTMGVARLHAGRKRLTGARATDRLGQSVPLEARQEGGTALLRYPNNPDGVIVYASWQ
ncbi:MAG TPA: hypothetical protein VFB38_05885 [Chthonomonadaceae bacterium]|nr:hypothetical protein [Chthonomonadaceae bacterium]